MNNQQKELKKLVDKHKNLASFYETRYNYFR